MKNSISQIASLLGVSTEMIRKYEKKSLLRVKRNEENGYRKYNAYNIVSLLWNRKMMAAGFSISQVLEFINEGNVERILDSVEKRKAEIVDEIAKQKEILNGLNEWAGELMAYEYKKKEKYSIELRHPIRMIATFNPDGSVADLNQIERVKEWVPYMANVFHGYTIDLEKLESKKTSSCGGLCIKEGTTSNNLDLPYDYRLPEQVCVTSYCIGTEFQPITFQELSGIFRFIKDEGYRVSGDVFGELLLLWETEGKHNYLQKVWVPILSDEDE